ncbi:Cobalamin synthesis G C-terminus [Rhizobium sp. RU20A]|uniref:cobalamin biosynthesis protein n=1 Tax=Rhizobium sp. RU20A TaxID=1907412 RepID=UPI0009569FB0|nr:cobalamin biosynthesis protein [Rhizobium sp. RU20A]SIQ16036.1 Cobalamin synthesis G C-terminus [Rhizobium sp. RU20A]
MSAHSAAFSASRLLFDGDVSGVPSAASLFEERLILGLGCECGTSAAELIALAETLLATTSMVSSSSSSSISAIATIDGRAGEPAMHAAAAHFGVPLLVFDAARLERETPRLATPSEVVFRLVGCHGVAESAALAAAGPGGDLVAAKRKSSRATAALAWGIASKSDASLFDFVESKQAAVPVCSHLDSACSCIDSAFSAMVAAIGRAP